MFCPNCGEKLPDGSKFCGVCGFNLSEIDQETEETAQQGETASKPSAPVPSEQEAVQPGLVQPKKKPDKKIFIGIGAVAAVIVVVLLLSAVLSMGKSDNAYVYLSDGKYELLTNLKKDTTVEIASSKSDEVMSSLLAFSEDGKYVYYYTKYDAYSGTGSLCRAQFGKLKENSSKNDKYIDVIATNVKLGFRFLDDGTLTYVNGDNALYWYDGKETTQVAKNIQYYYTDGSARIVYTTGDDIDGYTLYGVSLSDIDNKVKLASNYSTVYNAMDFDNIFYSKVDDDYNETLYVVGFDKDSEKLGSNVRVYSTGEGVIYFSAENGTRLNLYDYVEDSYQSADAGLSEPDLEDYEIPSYRYYSLDRNSDPSLYEDIYTSCSKPTAFYQTWFSYRSLEYAAANDSEHSADYQAFVDKYLEKEDSDGYIVITGSVRTDLKDLAEACGDGSANEWLKLCFYREQSGTSYDYDAYYAACDAYNEAEDRIELREKLQSSDSNYPVLSLYCYDKGNLTSVSDDVLSCMSMNGAIMYNTTGLITDKIRMDDIYSVGDVASIFAVDPEAENYLLLTEGTSTCQMSASAAESYAEANENGYTSLYVSESNVFMSADDGDLYVASIDKGIVGDFDIITDDASVLKLDDSTLYYAYGIYTNNGYSYCDLYAYVKGESKCLAKDIMLDTIVIYSDDVILAYTDYRSLYGYELTMIASDGTKTLIADDVTQYIRVDKSTLLYISDGDLYSYNGKEKTRLRSDADWVWAKDSMEVAVRLYY